MKVEREVTIPAVDHRETCGHAGRRKKGLFRVACATQNLALPIPRLRLTR